MKVVVTGAAGNVGRSVVEALAERDEVSQIVGLAGASDGVRKRAADRRSRLFRGADAVVHLAWAVQPSHSPEKLERINVDGSRRVFDAVAAAAYRSWSTPPRWRLLAGTQGPPDRRGLAARRPETSFHARYKATIEGHLDEFERTAPNTQVVRLRPALTSGATPRRSSAGSSPALHPRLPAAQRPAPGDPAAGRALLPGDPHLGPRPRLRPGHGPRRQRRLQPRRRAAARRRRPGGGARTWGPFRSPSRWPAASPT